MVGHEIVINQSKEVSTLKKEDGKPRKISVVLL